MTSIKYYSKIVPLKLNKLIFYSDWYLKIFKKFASNESESFYTFTEEQKIKTM